MRACRFLLSVVRVLTCGQSIIIVATAVRLQVRLSVLRISVIYFAYDGYGKCCNVLFCVLASTVDCFPAELTCR